MFVAINWLKRSSYSVLNLTLLPCSCVAIFHGVTSDPLGAKSCIITVFCYSLPLAYRRPHESVPNITVVAVVLLAELAHVDLSRVRLL